MNDQLDFSSHSIRSTVIYAWADKAFNELSQAAIKKVEEHPKISKEESAAAEAKTIAQEVLKAFQKRLETVQQTQLLPTDKNTVTLISITKSNESLTTLSPQIRQILYKPAPPPKSLPFWKKI